MKRKLGDKIKIRSLEWYNENKDGGEKVNAGSQSFVKDMSKYCGMQATITSVYDYYYLIDIDKSQWSWTDEMFEEQLDINTMEQKKKFEPFERILVKGKGEEHFWYCAIFSHETDTFVFTIGENSHYKKNYDFIHFAGNEHLVGTSEMPYEEVELKEGELVFAFDGIDSFEDCMMVLRKFAGIYEDTIIAGNNFYWEYCIPFSKFNPNDMEETKKHILCVKNGKIVRWKCE